MASFPKNQSIHKSTPMEFWNFVFDRQSVYHNRFVLKRQPPWSDNKILNTFKFTNAYRELDRVTIYLINRVINNGSLTNSQKVFAILIFRIFNQDQLFDLYFSCVPSWQFFDAKVWISELDKAKDSGLNLFNNAYNITQRTYCEEWRKGEKHAQHLLNLQNISKDWEKLFCNIEQARSPKDAFDIICSLNFFGKFLSGQCMTDISYIKGFLPSMDWDEWYPVGPGAEGGLDLYSACVVSDYEKALKSVWESQDVMFKRLLKETGKDWMAVRCETPYRTGEYLSLNNIQNCFCEYRKFCNYSSGDLKRIKYYKQKGE
jgi:hypothetical protein